MDSLVSIIIPVYNLEGYIENCINSIISQTYKNLEILCVDDGSADKSGEIIRALCEKDNRVVYVKKENGGVSSARNIGLGKATGDYVMFVDGDDYIHPQAVEILINALLNTQCGMVSADFKSTADLTQNFEKQENSNYKIVSYDDFFIKEKPVLSQSVWGKLYKKEYLLNLKFNESTIFYEDTIFNFEFLLNKAEICLISNVLYFYYDRPGSVTKSGYKPRAIHTIPGFSKLCKKLVNLNELKLFSQGCERMLKFGLTLRTQAYGTEHYNEVKNIFNNARSKWFKLFLKSEFVPIKDKFTFTLFCYSRFLYELFRLITDPSMKEFYKNRKG